METQELNRILPVSDEQIQAIETGRNKLLERAESLIIHDAATEAVGWGLVNGIADLKKEITDDFEPARIATHAAWKAVVAQRDGHIDKLIEPDKIVREKLAVWDAEKKRVQEQAERKAREEAAAEQRRLQAIADDEARAENERRRKELEEKRIQEAIEAERNGHKDVAAAILEKPVEVAPVVAPHVMVAPSVVPNGSYAKVDGAGSMVDNWQFRITNQDIIPREYMLIDEKSIGAIVKRLKKIAEKTIPGIEVYNQPTPRTSGRR